MHIMKQIGFTKSS